MTQPARPLEALLPLIGITSLLLAAMLVFAGRCLFLGTPRTSYIEARQANPVWKWLMEWWVWLWGPVERVCVAVGISPSAITLASAVVTAMAAWLLASGAIAAGGWVFLFGSSLDLVDGRVARARGVATRAGAFLDSTIDRIGELLVFGALAIHFRSSPALVAALAAAGSSFVVSYARARGESLGVLGDARVGGMQRAERVVLTGVPCALSPLAAVAFGAGADDVAVGSALAILAVLTTFTAVRRFASIWRALAGHPDPDKLGNVRWLDTARRRLGP